MDANGDGAADEVWVRPLFGVVGIGAELSQDGGGFRAVGPTGFGSWGSGVTMNEVDQLAALPRREIERIGRR